jgi:hypothetical protein
MLLVISKYVKYAEEDENVHQATECLEFTIICCLK